MSDSTDFIKSVLSLKEFQYPHYWVTPNAMRKLCIAAFATSISLSIFANISFWYSIFLVFAMPLVVALTWHLVREGYWRFGSGIRIGVAYDGYSVPWDDWTRTQTELATLMADGHIRTRVHLKLIPSNAVDTPNKRLKFHERTNISTILKVTESPSAADRSKPAFHFEIHGRQKATVEKAFIEATLKHTAHLMHKNASIGNTLSEILKYRAKGLYQSALLMAASIEYTEKRFLAAAAVVEVLERSLSDNCGPTEYPRKNIRWLHVSCLTDKSIFPGDDPPKGDDLIEIVRLCDHAMNLYKEEFPFILLRQARNLFYAGDLDKALEYSLLYRSSGAPDTPTARLHCAVLHLFLGQWKEADVCFEHILKNNELKAFDLGDLIGFADYAFESGYESASYLQILYRSARGDKVIPESIQRHFEVWEGSGTGEQANLSRHIKFVTSPTYLQSHPNASPTSQESRRRDKTKKNMKKKRKAGK